MNKVIILPFYAKASLLLVGLYVFVYMLFLTKGLLVPLIFSAMFASVLSPVVEFLVRKKLNRVVAIALTLIVVIAIIAAFSTFLISQVSRFNESWPILVEKFTELVNQSIIWTSNYLDIDTQKIMLWVSETKTEFFNTGSAEIGNTLVFFGSGVMVLLLIPVYVFMILYYQPILLEFFRRVFGSKNRSEVSEVIVQVKTVIQLYLSGLILEVIIVSSLNTAALLILGIDYAILLGIVGGILNLIPYLGGVVAVALPMMIAFVTKASPWSPFYVLAIYYFIQLVDNNYIVPKIVASKVRINALVSIIVVLAFGALWGIPGMFLSIPLTAIVKLICDRIEPVQSIGFLLGDSMPAFPLLTLPTLKNKGP